MEPKKIYEDEHLMAFHKPHGLLTVAAQKRGPNLYDYVKKKYSNNECERTARARSEANNLALPVVSRASLPTKIMALHRLDRDTSGIVLFAKTRKCYEEAVGNRKFNGVKKLYIALIAGVPRQKTGVISKPLATRQNPRVALPAKTSYKVIKTYSLPEGEQAALVEVEIEHGRKHQIRKHFAMISHPLLMDREYMERRRYKYFQQLIKLRRFFLHARKVSFRHFVTDQFVEIDTGIPEELTQAEQKIIKENRSSRHKPFRG